jgi:outer membrane receptor protein involved in Fe transport
MKLAICTLMLLLSACLLGPAVHAQGAGALPYRGRSVQAVIEELRAAGAPLVYSSNLLPPDLRVRDEPQSSEPLALAREILQPHGLTIRDSDGVWLVVRGEPAPAAPPPTGRVAVSVARGDGEGIDGATVQLDAPAGPSATLTDGRAELSGIVVGRHTIIARAPGYLAERTTVGVTAGETAQIAITLLAAAPPLEEITVTASRYELVSDVAPSGRYFSRDDIESLSELGDDVLRIAHRVPGIASNEFSGRSHVRGGATDEMLIELDGIELVEPFHLRDYQAVFSAIDQRIVSSVQVHSGGFPAAYGDALSGLTVIDVLEPRELRHELGLSFLQTSGLSSGRFHDDRAYWLASFRQGNIDKLLHAEIGEPSYRDSFIRIGTRLGRKHELSLSGLTFDDDITLTAADEPAKSERGASATSSEQLWLKVTSDWTSRLASTSWLYSNDLETQRRGALDDPLEIVGVAQDERALASSGLKQEWVLGLPNHRLSGGFVAERLDAAYDYSSAVDIRGVLATLDVGVPSGTRDLSLQPEGDVYAAYFSDRIRLAPKFVAEVGIRWDKQTFLQHGEDRQFMPRASLLYRAGARTDLRLSYGKYFQAEEILELQVEDGVSEFGPAQDASHSIVSMEHRFENDLQLRVEWFRKWTKSARARFENLYDPLALLPELRPGRVKVSPSGAEARGFEIFLDGTRPVSWWVALSFAHADDVVDSVAVPRNWDQQQAVAGGVTWDVGAWTLSGAGTYHSGWPVTGLSLSTVTEPTGESAVIATAGDRNTERLDALHRIDVRAERDFRLGLGSLGLFAEITNLTGRSNPCCVRYTPIMQYGATALEREELDGLPLTVNVGVLWEF